eukprot:CAMPEP_0197024600 /NCGR_PEP_ID=MMETSP1384-20130603/5115_1 /TAXON_ID=29189 /ORGANISM="Ammonia sp." /LENGTH=379 /DNA_ID=CAMNT_0042453009 /DNA_START=55 /DNA_END=1191 /DNA_ORIENTATION=+
MEATLDFSGMPVFDIQPPTQTVPPPSQRVPPPSQQVQRAPSESNQAIDHRLDQFPINDIWELCLIIASKIVHAKWNTTGLHKEFDLPVTNMQKRGLITLCRLATGTESTLKLSKKSKAECVWLCGRDVFAIFPHRHIIKAPNMLSPRQQKMADRIKSASIDVIMNEMAMRTLQSREEDVKKAVRGVVHDMVEGTHIPYDGEEAMDEIDGLRRKYARNYGTAFKYVNEMVLCFQPTRKLTVVFTINHYDRAEMMSYPNNSLLAGFMKMDHEKRVAEMAKHRLADTEAEQVANTKAVCKRYRKSIKRVRTRIESRLEQYRNIVQADWDLRWPANDRLAPRALNEDITAARARYNGMRSQRGYDSWCQVCGRSDDVIPNAVW